MTPEEEAEFRKRIHIKNLKRTLSKLGQHPDLTDEYLSLKQHIEKLEAELQ